MEMPTQERDPSVLVIGFHHARGPEIELCIGNEGDEYIHPDDWSLLPFMALTDGAHLYCPPSLHHITSHQTRQRETDDRWDVVSARTRPLGHKPPTPPH
ncbi:late secretory pathway protein avl9 [Ascosphaera atra]|nr:late secretory pathway protein avl9 [Ascosphaera atra]